MNFVELKIWRPGSRQHTVIAPKVRVAEIIDEYRLLGWDVSW